MELQNSLVRSFGPLFTAVVLALGLSGTAQAQSTMGGAKKMDSPSAQGDQMKMMGMMEKMAAKVPRFPPVRGFGGGGEVFFIHSEASDPKISEVLSLMMGSPVITVPALAKAPEAMLATVYVFKNGLKGMGPLGFQPDIFDRLPGSEGYRPLRRLHLVTWKANASPRELTSVEALMEAKSRGELTLERTDVVVNMPMLLWPLGRR